MKDVFCRIVKGEVPAKKVFESAEILAIEDADPKAKIHILIFPKLHVVESVNDKIPERLPGEIFTTVREVAEKLGFENSGYRVITNHQSDAEQSVDHLHFHVLAGEKLKDI